MAQVHSLGNEGKEAEAERCGSALGQRGKMRTVDNGAASPSLRYTQRLQGSRFSVQHHGLKRESVLKESTAWGGPEVSRRQLGGMTLSSLTSQRQKSCHPCLFSRLPITSSNGCRASFKTHLRDSFSAEATSPPKHRATSWASCSNGKGLPKDKGKFAGHRQEEEGVT